MSLLIVLLHPQGQPNLTVIPFVVLPHRQGQPDGDRQTLVRAFAGCVNASVIGSYESTGDPESQSEARSHLRLATTPKELLSKQGTVLGVKAGTFISDGNHELS